MNWSVLLMSLNSLKLIKSNMWNSKTSLIQHVSWTTTVPEKPFCLLIKRQSTLLEKFVFKDKLFLIFREIISVPLEILFSLIFFRLSRMKKSYKFYLFSPSICIGHFQIGKSFTIFWIFLFWCTMVPSQRICKNEKLDSH